MEEDFNFDKRRVETILVTKEIAESWLKRNISNRDLKKPEVKYHMEEMEKQQKNGICDYDIGDCIKFNKEGILRDGQHRLMALCLSTKVKAARMDVKFGITKKEELKINLGKKVSLSDKGTMYLKPIGINKIMFRPLCMVINYLNHPGYFKSSLNNSSERVKKILENENIFNIVKNISHRREKRFKTSKNVFGNTSVGLAHEILTSLIDENKSFLHYDPIWEKKVDDKVNPTLYALYEFLDERKSENKYAAEGEQKSYNALCLSWEHFYKNDPIYNITARTPNKARTIYDPQNVLEQYKGIY